MTQAIGMIETKGLAISIVVADSMLKAADVKIVRQETIDLALVTIAIEGDLEAVHEAIHVGLKIAKQFNKFISYNIVPRPDDPVVKLVREISKKPT
ncbi:MULTISPECIES: BMC domain-containing protein [Lysinibacillus]|uniref:BMC domain-containing protein n=1 Tax=Lysinibacillus antri TaxID=2498145 RepID=A0A3S0RXF4_9BACI|nr:MULTISPECIES: BMC domain-containing protein [Lysinibacillus]RUL55880.1 BMC domain-containing protein [Lysinibacillus antri]TSI11483.1 BMC domain-containing protein [Lysinibacillus sp. BW-2-10]